MKNIKQGIGIKTTIEITIRAIHSVSRDYNIDYTRKRCMVTFDGIAL